MVSRLIRLLGWTREGAIDTTMHSEERIGSANRSRGDVRSNPPTHLTEFSVSKLMQQFIKRRRICKTPHLFEGDFRRQLPEIRRKQGKEHYPTDCIR
ncbi:hypothetical protein Q5691_08900 [Microcoleus sp. w1-18aA5]|uniref:hypothetical protein n=1 Tax=unclassified Microcoleus TaxID=2642155 RepID=UPI002FD280AC